MGKQYERRRRWGLQSEERTECGVAGGTGRTFVLCSTDSCTMGLICSSRSVSMTAVCREVEKGWG
jgi:hypothetical protein